MNKHLTTHQDPLSSRHCMWYQDVHQWLW